MRPATSGRVALSTCEANGLVTKLVVSHSSSFSAAPFGGKPGALSLASGSRGVGAKASKPAAQRSS